MKIDLSTVLLVIVCVIPGLFAQRSRNLVCPRSFDTQGATAELGELVALGVSTHGILICLFSLGCVLAGTLLWGSPGHYLAHMDGLPLLAWINSHPLESLSCASIYVFCTFAISHWLGLIYGLWRLRSPVTTAVLSDSELSKELDIPAFMKRLGFFGLLGERPIIYEALSPGPAASGEDPPLIFVEIELKDHSGFYSGQVSQYSILRDSEPHKPIYLINAYFKLQRADAYQLLEADGILLDLADALAVQIKQTRNEMVGQAESPAI